MTRKDYELIASVIAAARVEEYNGAPSTREWIAEHLATALEVDNPIFRKDIFMEACNIPGWKKTKQLLRK